eukprot:TRINITY_DN32847_c0_g1_i1.p1 TRINITY_DN32847_c0_g1~~TRINITY_DN32847_c0_g1_i1.p1  ORF type:complete len:974 (+),score=195.45 TRINITY_DN32847_c0_g1_i1:63-2984(+)
MSLVLSNVLPTDTLQYDESTTRSQALLGDQNALQDLILTCNKDGMEALKSGEHEAAFEHFKYAEAVLLTNQKDTDNTTLQAVTCNNIGCYYKKVGKYHGALSYLRKALKMEVELHTDQVTVAGTHLNLCAVLSKLEKHEKAMQHALCALELMSKRINETGKDVAQEDYAVLAIAYHNVATEREFLQQWDQAATSFQTGYQVAKKMLGDNHPLTMTLGKNANAVFKKAKDEAVAKHGVAMRGTSRALMDADEGDGNNAAGLPALKKSGRTESPSMPMPRASVRADAADWVKAEEALWSNFSKKVLGDGPAPPTPQALMGAPRDRQSMSPRDALEVSPLSNDGGELQQVGDASFTLKPLSTATLRNMKQLSLADPATHDMGTFRMASPSTKNRILTKTPFIQNLEENPEALVDIIDAEGQNRTSVKAIASDFRPNRSMNRNSRTSRLVRRTGVFNSTVHRDRVSEDLAKRRAMLASGNGYRSAAAQKLAAERIQTTWRAWNRYCKQNSGWMTISWICATMIQSHWRSYHVRRKRMDKYAGVIQRFVRGTLVRKVLKKHKAAVCIQRHAVGVITRRKLRDLHEASIKIQRLTRGGLTRKHFRELKAWKIGLIVTIQCFIRVWLATRRTDALRQTRRQTMMLHKAAIDMQRFYRGWKGRQRAEELREHYHQARVVFRAAVTIQLLARRKHAKQRAQQLRDDRLLEMEKAATFLRKIWLGQQTRKRYRALQNQFQSVTSQIVTVQRYTRGCMCRLKLWREAVRAQEEIWATVTLQRRWRGYVGRVQWENAYEEMWRREMSAALIHRNVRGFLSRLRVSRMRRAIARGTFEKARRRFQAAVRVQAIVRGVQCRMVRNVRRHQVLRACVAIQRIARGRYLRKKMWQQVQEHRVIMMQAAARGYMVRRRKFHLAAKVICIQRAWRRWLEQDPAFRSMRKHKAHSRKRAAFKLQGYFREFASRKALQRIQAASASRDVTTSR